MSKINEPLPYWKQRQQMKMQGKKPESLKRQESKAKSSFFEIMIAKAPPRCMESGKPLAGTMKINPAAVVAHILPKSKFKSIALNPLNIVYLEGSVHTDFDNKGEAFIKKMKIFPLLVERIAEMWHDMPEDEKNKVPLFYLK